MSVRRSFVKLYVRSYRFTTVPPISTPLLNLAAPGGFRQRAAKIGAQRRGSQGLDPVFNLEFPARCGSRRNSIFHRVLLLDGDSFGTKSTSSSRHTRPSQRRWAVKAICRAAMPPCGPSAGRYPVGERCPHHHPYNRLRRLRSRVPRALAGTAIGTAHVRQPTVYRPPPTTYSITTSSTRISRSPNATGRTVSPARRRDTRS